MKRATFPNKLLPWLLLAPQLVVTFVFFLWPAAQALFQSVLRQDPFGLSTKFVGLANFTKLLADPLYIDAFLVTLIFCAGTVALAMGLGLVFALALDRIARGATAYTSVLVWPYAVAPAVAAILWWFLFNPSVGIAAYALSGLGIDWNHQIDGGQALLLVILASAWKQVSYNVLFFLAGLQAIPRTMMEAAAMDGVGPVRRIRRIVLPLLAPTTFFLLVVNLVYAFFDTFGVIHATTEGGPGRATTTLVYKVYRDGFVALDLGSSAAQSVILMVLVIVLTAIQFRYVERRVSYA